jgi:hypothetical protein
MRLEGSVKRKIAGLHHGIAAFHRAIVGLQCGVVNGQKGW